jgi:hypothetical protein
LGRAEAGDQGKEGKHRDSDIHFDVDRINAILGYDDVGLGALCDQWCTHAPMRFDF